MMMEADEMYEPTGILEDENRSDGNIFLITVCLTLMDLVINFFMIEWLVKLFVQKFLSSSYFFTILRLRKTFLLVAILSKTSFHVLSLLSLAISPVLFKQDQFSKMFQNGLFWRALLISILNRWLYYFLQIESKF